MMLSQSFLKAVPPCLEKSAFDGMIDSKWRNVDASKAGKAVTTMSCKVSLHFLSFCLCARSSPCRLGDLAMQRMVFCIDVFWRFVAGCDFVMGSGLVMKGVMVLVMFRQRCSIVAKEYVGVVYCRGKDLTTSRYPPQAP